MKKRKTKVVKQNQNLNSMKRYIILTIIAAIVATIMLYLTWDNTPYNNETEHENIVNEEYSTSTIFADSEKLQSIRNREEVKKQQEFIVQKIYLTEEKDRIQREKEAAIRDFDAQILEFEQYLEEVREHILSF